MQAFWHFIVHDWYFALPMFAMSLTAITLVVWRIMLNMGAKGEPLDQLLPELQDRLAKDGVEGALKFCQDQTGVIPRKLLAAGLETNKQGLAAGRRAMANVVELEILPDLNFLLPTILAIAKIATMVGLLGTVISMIGTFSELEELRKTKGDIASQAGSIGLALFATALGLVTAIPSAFAHVLFKAWIGNFEIKMKNAAGKLILLLQAAKTGPVAATPAAPAGRSSQEIAAARR